MQIKTEKQFAAFYDKYADAIFRYCYYRVYQRELAKELSQESFCRLWSMVVDDKEITYPKAVIYRIARNLIIDHSRKKKEASLEEIQEVSGDAIFSDEKYQDYGDNLDIKAALKKLREKNESLSEVLEMKYLQGLKVKDIAHALEVSPNIASVRIHRAIKQLKELYGN